MIKNPPENEILECIHMVWYKQLVISWLIKNRTKYNKIKNCMSPVIIANHCQYHQPAFTYYRQMLGGPYQSLCVK